MNPMQMVLTKDYVKVLLHIIPNSAQPSFLSLPSIESMQHYKHINQVLTDQ